LGLVLLWLPTAGKGEETKPVTATPVTQAEKNNRIEFEWLPFPDDTKFGLLGLYWFAENSPNLWRMPKGRFDALPSGVKRRCKAPAGGRIVIKCNTTKLGLKVTPLSKGSLKVYFYDDNQECFKNLILEAGDMILLTSGGHGFETLAETTLVEIKQGPYDDKGDKVLF